jgi:oligopeptide transport system permease protein
VVSVATTRRRTAPEADVYDRPQRSLWRDAMYRLLRNRAALIGLGVIGFATFVALFAPVIAPYDPLEQHGTRALMEPLWTAAFGGKYTDPGFLFGSDSLGRDILSRLMYSSRVSLVIGVVPVTIVLVIGVTVGMLAGYAGGIVDDFLMRITDVVYAFPDLLFVIIIVATLRGTDLGEAYGGLLVIFIGIAVVNWVGVARLVRGQVLSVKNRDFVEAARAIGAGPGRIMRRHIFPNILAPVIVTVAFAVPGAMLTESVLSYLGIGIRPPTPTWGVMINEGFIVFSASAWPVLLPALCISIVLLAFTFVGDGLRDALDPRSKI